MMDELMAHAHDRVRVFLFDGEAANQVVRSVVHGELDAIFRRKIKDFKFFSRLTWQECPCAQELPRFPIKLCQVDRAEYIHAMPGSAHALKNSAAQICSPRKVVFFGSFMTDCSGGLAFDLPLPAFSRRDPMSDRLCSLLSNPMFLAEDRAGLVLFGYLLRLSFIKCMLRVLDYSNLTVLGVQKLVASFGG